MQKYIYLLGIGLIWGSQFIFNELALKSVSSISVAASRALIGAITLAVILWITNQNGLQVVNSQVSHSFRLWKRFL